MNLRDNDILLIVGKGETWREDIARFKDFELPHDVLGVNHAALWLDAPPKHAFSYHPNVMDEIKHQRPEVITHSLMPSVGVDHAHRMRGETGGSSSYLAVRVALERLGYPKVVLAGAPLSGRYYMDFAQQWVNGLWRIKDKARSFSGATYALLGAPTREWLIDG